MKGEIEQVAEWYQQNTHLPHSSIPGTSSSPIPDLQAKVPDDLVKRASQSYGGTAINVFGVVLDIYVGVEPEKAIFVGVGSALAGAGTGVLLSRVLSGPPGWISIAAQITVSVVATQYLKNFWDDHIPDEVKQWFDDMRNTHKDTAEERRARHEWREQYNRERGIPGGGDLKGP